MYPRAVAIAHDGKHLAISIRIQIAGQTRASEVGADGVGRHSNGLESIETLMGGVMQQI